MGKWTLDIAAPSLYMHDGLKVIKGGFVRLFVHASNALLVDGAHGYRNPVDQVVWPTVHCTAVLKFREVASAHFASRTTCAS